MMKSVFPILFAVVLLSLSACTPTAQPLPTLVPQATIPLELPTLFPSPTATTPSTPTPLFTPTVTPYPSLTVTSVSVPPALVFNPHVTFTPTHLLVLTNPSGTTGNTQLVAYPIEENGTPQTAMGVILIDLPSTPQCQLSGFNLSPDSHYLAVRNRCGDGVIDLTTQPVDSLSVPAQRFLSWSPDGEWLLMFETSWREIWLVPVQGGEPTYLDMLEEGYTAVFTPDGQEIIYATYKGLGFGSSLGVFDLTSGDLTVQQTEPDRIFSRPIWSPDGQYLVYILMPDSSTPFTTGELWLADAQGQPIRRLAEGVDTGHGYHPIWIEDGTKVVYVHRENPMGSEADYEAEALHSNLYEVAIAGGDPMPLTQFSETLVKDPAWLPGAELLAFSAGDQVWVVRPGRSPERLDLPAAANGYPLWITLPQ